MNKQKRVLIIAGESSGDQHAASYVRQHQKINPDIIFDAFGQKELKSTSANLIYDTENIAVVGIIEVISKYKQINDFDFVLTIDFDFSYRYLDLVSILNSNLENSIVIGKRKFFDEGVFRQSITTCSELIIFMKSFSARNFIP